MGTRKSVRMTRWRTDLRAGLVPGQPAQPRTHPDIDKAPYPTRHVCGECFGPRHTYGGRLFCERCLDDLWGWPGTQNYDRWLTAMKRRQTILRKGRADA